MTTKPAYPTAETARPILGVSGRALPVHEPQNVRGNLVHRNQTWKSDPRPVDGYGTDGTMQVEIRFDDECMNGHQSFAITANVYTKESRRHNDIAAGGCMHDEIARVFPELAPLIKWHLVSTDGPMHYVANTVYLAGDRDYNGRRAGEIASTETRIRFGDFPILFAFASTVREFMKSHDGPFRPVAVPHVKKAGDSYDFKPKYTFEGLPLEWYKCPFDTLAECQQVCEVLNSNMPVSEVVIPTSYSEGKARELDRARIVAIWPDATDDDLCAEPDELRAVLAARLPALMTEFRQAMEKDCGFLWEPEIGQ